MAHELEIVYNECIDRVMAGESIESCLADYPKWADDLRGMLEVSGLVRQAALGVEASPEFRNRLKRQVLQAAPNPGVSPARYWRIPAWATGLAAGFLLVLVAGGAVIVSSGGSQPDQLLYPVKLGVEQAQIALSPASEKDNLRLQLAENRATEIAYLAEKGDSGLIDSVARNMETALTGQPANGSTQVAAPASPRAVMPSTQSGAAAAPAPLEAPLASPPAVVPQPETSPSSAQGGPSSTNATAGLPPAGAPGRAPVSTDKSLPDEGQDAVLASQKRTIQTLQEAINKATPETRPALEKALERARKAYEQALERIRKESEKATRDSWR
jgi:hypothetical protein